MKTQIQEKIVQFIRKTFSIPTEENFNMTSSLDSWIVDSIHVLSVVQFLEQEFGLEFVSEDMQAKHFANVESLVHLVQHKGFKGQLPI